MSATTTRRNRTANARPARDRCGINARFKDGLATRLLYTQVEWGLTRQRGIIVESDGLAQRRFDASEYRQHHRNGLGGGLSGEPCCKRHARFALMENEHRPC